MWRITVPAKILITPTSVPKRVNAMSEKQPPNQIQRTGYISELDQFLREFDQNRTEFPPERLREIAKAKKISDKRDRIVDEGQDFIWKNF